MIQACSGFAVTVDENTQARLLQAVEAQSVDLQAALTQGNWALAGRLIGQINDIRNQALYDEVGKLTRELHSALLDLQIDDNSPHAHEMSQITDANERLTYVMNMTEKAANDTMDLVEASAPLVNYISYEAQSLVADWQRFTRREMPLDEFKGLAKRIEAFLVRSLHDSDQMSGNLNDILLAQSFQDLTGQVIKRVTVLIGYIEASLARMGTLARTVDEVAGIEHDPQALKKQGLAPSNPTQGEGPQIRADKTADVVTDQVDVDDLLSSLGL